MSQHVPILSFVAIFGAISIVMVVYAICRDRTAARKNRNECVNCGYDLRATYDRCPECGTRFLPVALQPDQKLDVLKLRSDWPEDPAPLIKPSDEPIVVLLRLEDRVVAELLAEQLRHRGIWGVVRYELPTIVPAVFQVIVAGPDYRRAVQVVRQFISADSAYVSSFSEYGSG